MIIAGYQELVYSTGYSTFEEYSFYNGTQQSGTPFDFSGKTVLFEVKDPKRNTVIKTYTMAVAGNKVTWQLAALDIEPGQYVFRIAVVSPGKKEIYVNGKLIVNV